MSSLDKLLISGIRAFGPLSEEKIEFQTPVTLIVGHNGSGKTTIVECLKYSTTGQFPPNASKNASFINDPKLSNSINVMAQVKLDFKNVNGDHVVCTRNLQATRDKKTTKLKTLDSALLISDPNVPGKQFSITNKTTQMDNEMAHHLGVSKAILENVIFCHQEESFWPLGDPLTLKKIFDDIFASTRYTKALANLKDIKKNKSVELISYKKDLERHQIDKTRREDLIEKMTQSESKIEQLKQDIDNFDGDQLKNAQEEISTISHEFEHMSQLKNKKEQLVLRRELIHKSVSTISQNLQVFHGTDEELELKILTHQQMLENHQTDDQDLELKRHELQQQIHANTTTVQTLLSKQGQLQAQTQQYDQLVQERTKLAQEASDYLSLMFEDSESMLLRILDKTKQRTLLIQQEKQEFRTRESELIQKAQILALDQAQMEEKKRMIQQRLQDLNTKLFDLEQQKPTMLGGQEELDEIRAQIQLERNQLQHLLKQFDFHVYETSVQLKQQEIQDLDAQAQRLREEMSLLSHLSDSRARLQLKESDFNRKSDILKKHLSTLKIKWRESISEPFDPSTAESIYGRELEAKEQAMNLCRQKTHSTTNDIAIVDAKIQSLKQETQAKTQEFETKQSQVRKVIGSRDFSVALTEAEAEADSKKELVASMLSAGTMYRKFIAKFKDSGCCPLCVRKFDTNDEEMAFLKLLESTLDKVPSVQQKALQERDLAEQKRDKIRQLNGLYSDCERLQKTVLPNLRQQLLQLERERIKLNASMDDNESIMTSASIELDLINDIKPTLSEYMRTRKEVLMLEQDVQQLKREQQNVGSKSLDQLSQDYELNQSQCLELRRDIERLTSEAKIHQSKINNSESKIRELVEQQSQITLQLANNETVLKSIQSIKQEQEEQYLVLGSLEDDYQRLSERVQEQNQILESFSSQLSSKEQQLDAEKQKLDQIQSHLERIHFSVRDFQISSIRSQLLNVNESLESMEQQSNTLSHELEHILKQIDMLFRKKSEMQLMQRQLDDNLKLRQFQSEIKDLDVQISLLEQEIMQLDEVNIIERLKQAQEKFEDLKQHRGSLQGQMSAIKQNILDYQKTLDHEFKSTLPEYKRCKVTVQTESLALKDVELYMKALEKAIVKYHEQKMSEINKIIRELWSKTYRGHDIDYIEIRAEEPQGATRNITYRVIMVKGDAEMEMRGRCSAGQKVLACIIIRLALAEAFCVHCGLLALDEPTTNLDEANIQALASSLVSIIEERSIQSNFQLIIITHDEDFIQTLASHNLIEKYYRVCKDPESYQSMIIEESI
ncbi:AAA domain-containing protein [Gorgonomyces haynaldii]|nr:AAA domain-containing protein [Gorgonomyces haynaldii]